MWDGHRVTHTLLPLGVRLESWDQLASREWAAVIWVFPKILQLSLPLPPCS